MLTLSQKQAGSLGFISKKKKKRNKFNAKKQNCLIAKHLHDSKAEATHCDLLSYQKQNGEIRDFEVSRVFTLVPEFLSHHNRVRPTRYIADFVVTRKDGTIEIQDVKGGKATATPAFRLKWKLLQYLFRNDKDVSFKIISK